MLAGIYYVCLFLFMILNRDTIAICEIRSKLTMKDQHDVINVSLVYLLLILNIVHTLF